MGRIKEFIAELLRRPVGERQVADRVVDSRGDEFEWCKSDFVLEGAVVVLDQKIFNFELVQNGQRLCSGKGTDININVSREGKKITWKRFLAENVPQDLNICLNTGFKLYRGVTKDGYFVFAVEVTDPKNNQVLTFRGERFLEEDSSESL